MTDPIFSEQEIKESVRKRYAGAIGQSPRSCCGPAPSQPVQTGGSCCGTAPSDPMKGKFAAVAGYGDEELKRLPADAVQNSFGCGNPLAFAGVRAGQTVLDIGSGAGIDCLIAAERVEPTGKVIGLDMTPEMIKRARQNAREAGAKNVEFRLGEAEKMPVEDGTVDWLISNCVINLSPDKPAVFREVARVLKPGGRISISDIVAEELPEAIRRSRDAWTGCLAGAISEADYVKGLKEAGLRDLRVTSRIVYEASQLKGLFASSCCGVSAEAGLDASALAEAAAGKIWSARFEGVKPYPVPVLADVIIEPAASGDLAGVQSLLADSGLPTDVEGHLETFLVARHDGRLVGCVGMEFRGLDALFRSLAVEAAYRGAGLGRRLYDALVVRAIGQGVERAYLLTTTIAPLAEAWGFRRLDRGEVPAAIRQTHQFDGACCASAVAMWQDLKNAVKIGCS
ncbi:MAG: arsenite methyltransferase [candidate division NC10 bacterium]